MSLKWSTAKGKSLRFKMFGLTKASRFMTWDFSGWFVRMNWSGSTDGRPCAVPTSLQGGETMSAITKVTRRMSYEEILEGLGQRHQMILEALRERPRSTARELALFLWERKAIPMPERNFVHPRLTELMQAGLVEAVDKKRCPITGKMVAVYELASDPVIEQGELELG